MRKTFIVLAIIFASIGLVLTILPLGTLPLLLITPAIIFSVLAILFSKDKPKKLPKWLLIVTATLFFVVIGKEVFTNDKVSSDANFMKVKENSVQDAQQELEEIEGLK